MDGFEYTPPTPEQEAISRRQSAVYNALAFFTNKAPTEDEFFSFVKRVVAYVEASE